MLYLNDSKKQKRQQQKIELTNIERLVSADKTNRLFLLLGIVRDLTGAQRADKCEILL